MLFPRIAGMDAQALSSRILPWHLIIGGALLVALILSGIGVVMAWAPNAADTKSDVVVVAGSVPTRTDVEAPTLQKCMECGVIESRRTIVRDEAAAAAGASTPAMVGGLNEIRRGSVSVSEVKVRMNDGTSRQFVDASLSNSHNWHPGERMIFIEGVSTSSR
jgi:hypothetical protein